MPTLSVCPGLFHSLWVSQGGFWEKDAGYNILMPGAGIAQGWCCLRCSPGPWRVGGVATVISFVLFMGGQSATWGREASGPWGLPSGNCKRGNPHFWRGMVRNKLQTGREGPPPLCLPGRHLCGLSSSVCAQGEKFRLSSPQRD